MADLMNNVWQPVIIDGVTYGTDEYSSMFNSRPMVYQVEPERALDFSIPDINNIARGEVNRVWLTFDYLSIQRYRQLLKALRKPEFSMTYYDIETDTMITGMYYSTTFDQFETYSAKVNGQMEIIGVLNCSFELIATNNNTGELRLEYVAGGGTGASIAQTFFKGETVQILDDRDAPNFTRAGYRYDSWVDDTGVVYTMGEYVTLSASLTLYPNWVGSNKYTLSFDYSGATYIDGLGESEDNYISSQEVTYGEIIQTLPSPNYYIHNPYVDSDIENYVEVYDFHGWWQFPYDKVTNNGVHGDEKYQYNAGVSTYSIMGNSTAYAHWVPIDFTLRLDANGGTFASSVNGASANATAEANWALSNNNSVASVTLGYGMAMTRPQNPTKSGASFAGWFFDNESYATQYTSWSMIYPQDGQSQTLYAKWVEA